MSKKKAIGHLCGKLANLIYSLLKNNHKYDPKVHATACGVDLEEFISKEKEEPLLLN